METAGYLIELVLLISGLIGWRYLHNKRRREAVHEIKLVKDINRRRLQAELKENQRFQSKIDREAPTDWHEYLEWHRTISHNDRAHLKRVMQNAYPGSDPIPVWKNYTKKSNPKKVKRHKKADRPPVLVYSIQETAGGYTIVWAMNKKMKLVITRYRVKDDDARSDDRCEEILTTYDQIGEIEDLPGGTIYRYFLDVNDGEIKKSCDVGEDPLKASATEKVEEDTLSPGAQQIFDDFLRLEDEDDALGRWDDYIDEKVEEGIYTFERGEELKELARKERTRGKALFDLYQDK